MFNCFIRTHSKRHLEIKTEYPLTDDQTRPVFDMDFYFFFPSQLHVTESRVGVERFLSNVQIYTRFSSPSLSLTLLVDPECELSPLFRIRNSLSSSSMERSSGRDRILHELQMLANIFRAETAGFVIMLRKELTGGNREQACRKRVLQFLNELKTFLKSFRELHTLFLDASVTDKQREALAWADETVSIIVERNLNRLFSYCGMMDKPAELREKLECFTRKETEYRRSMNYQYLYREEDERSGERLAYRESILKKWSQSAMYMSSAESRAPRRIAHILAGAAAGVAMIFAVLFSIFAERFYAPNSTPWILLIVLSYIFKDRIKEILREVFGRSMPRLASDQLSLLKDPAAGRRVGVSKGKVGYMSASSVPGNIRERRYRQPNPFRSILPDQDVIHYKRLIRFDARKLRSNHTRLRGVTEIVRIQIDDWLREMDDPKDVFYRLEKGRRLKIKGNRVYRVELVVALRRRNSDQADTLYHYRIVMKKDGILRIEAVEQR